MGKKSIGILIYANPDYYPPTINAVHLLSEHFDIILIGRNQHPPHWQYPSNVSVHRLGEYTSVQEREQASAGVKLWEYIKFIAQASRLLTNVSLIYAYDAFGYTSAYLCRLLQHQQTPLIYHNHDLNYQLFSLSSLSGWVQRGELKWVHKANLLVFPSQERALLFKRLTNFNGELMIVPNFPRKSYFKEHVNFTKLILERFQKPNILLQGTISIKNSLLELINSLSYLDSSVELKLIGPIKEEEKDLMKDLVIRNQVAERVQYVPPVPYNELPWHTWEASIGVCLYQKTNVNHQTMGTASNKIYEYAACGLPVIVSDQPDYREHLAGETWVSFADPDNPESIAFAVKNILTNFDKYEKMCLSARRAFEEKYNYESAFSSLFAKIQDLANFSKLAKN
ncbi:MAG: glycosyltransferase [Nostoc sp. ChiSLP02]|nr:glycosyltransferase [Nostoc sp. DedSLP05]MDZ8100811.1 glycosyltransferase [Nostoc sp. DedSLP01]MDZ8188200.1 glycosyltransferase [Nostoc sp. ChiSLP02]